MFFDPVGDFIRVVSKADQIEMFRFDISAGQHGVFQPIEHPFPIFFPDHIDGERFDFFCLDESQRFEELVQGAESTGRTTKACAYRTNITLRTKK